MRVVVAGGTGFIGREVVSRLLEERGVEVAVTTRRPERPDSWDGRVRKLQAFAGDVVSLGKAFTGADTVVHAIQFPNHPVEDPGKGRTYMEVDAKGTVAAVGVAKKLGVRRFIYLSGAGAGRNLPQPWMKAKDIAERRIVFVRVGRLVRIPEGAIDEMIASGMVEPIDRRRRRGAA